MAWNYDDDEINGVIDSNIKDSPPNPPAVNTASTMRSMLKLYWAVIRSQVSRAVNDVDLFIQTTLTNIDLQLNNQTTTVNASMASTIAAVNVRATAAEAKADSVFSTFSLANGIGTYNATTGIYTVKETGATGTLTTVANQTNGKYFDVVVAGTQSITGSPITFNAGDRIISRGTKWDYIPNIIPSDVLKKDVLTTEFPLTGNVTGSYVQRTNGDIAANPDYNRTLVIPVASLKGDVFVDLGTFGAAILPVAYYLTAAINAANFISGEVGTSSSGSGSQLLNYKLTIPSNAAYIVLSCNKNFSMALRYYDKDAVKTNSAALSDIKKTADSASSNLMAYYPFAPVAGSFVQRLNGDLGTNAGYSRTGAIPLSALQAYGDGSIYVDIPNMGGSVLPVAYYSTASISAGSFISGEIASTSTGAVQLTKYKLTPPSNANYVVFTYANNVVGFYLSIYYQKKDIVRQASLDGDVSTFDHYLFTAQGINNRFVNPFNTLAVESSIMYRRAGRLANISSDVLPLFFFFGQSNADGRAPQSSAPAFLSGNAYQMDNFIMWDKVNKAFNPYKSGVNTGASNNVDTRFSFDIFVAKAWLDANPGKKFYAIKHTLGGVPITQNGTNTGNNNYRWQPKTELITAGQGSMCLDLITKLQEAKTYAKNNRLKLMPMAVFYHQGEGDADRAADGGVTDYPVNLANLINWFRGLFGTSSLPFINGTIMAGYNSNYPLINNVFTTLNSLDPNMKTVDMTGHQTSIGDNLHYDATALEYLGQQMYAYYASL